LQTFLTSAKKSPTTTANANSYQTSFSPVRKTLLWWYRQQSILGVFSGDIKRVHLKSGGPRRDTDIFAIHFIDNDSGMPETIHTEKIPIIGFPEGETFNPHGISCYTRARRRSAFTPCHHMIAEIKYPKVPYIEIFHLVRGDEGGSEEVGDKRLQSRLQ
jgi:hypothetical protein